MGQYYIHVFLLLAIAIEIVIRNNGDDSCSIKPVPRSVYLIRSLHSRKMFRLVRGAVGATLSLATRQAVAPLPRVAHGYVIRYAPLSLIQISSAQNVLWWGSVKARCREPSVDYFEMF